LGLSGADHLQPISIDLVSFLEEKRKNYPAQGISTVEAKYDSPRELDAVRYTQYVPGVTKVWIGFCSVDVAPSPKSHFQEEGSPVERSVNVTFRGAHPDKGT
jgi:hypothetical protein